MNEKQKKILTTLAIVLAAVISFVLLGGKYSEPEAYERLSQSIDRKSDNALLLTGSVTVASAAVTLLPEDIATPVAEKIADFTEYFVAALCILYAEKYLMPVIGFSVFKVLIPLTCLLLIFWVLTRRSNVSLQLAMRILIFSLVMWVAIPVSIKVSDIIYETRTEAITDTISNISSFTEDLTVSNFIEKSSALLNGVVQALAVTIVTSCIIPIVVLILFIWLAKVLLGAIIPNPIGLHRKKTTPRLAGRAVRRKLIESSKKED